MGGLRGDIPRISRKCLSCVVVAPVLMILNQKENLATDFGVVADPEEAREVDGFVF